MINKIHFSIDDTITLFEDLNRNKYSSIFDNKILNFLKLMHEKYEIKVTLFCFYENYDKSFNLKMMTDRYYDDFVKSSDWLHFGFHGISGNDVITKIDFEEFKNKYSNFSYNMKRIGCLKLEQNLRIHCYDINTEIINYLKEQLDLKILFCGETLKTKNYNLKLLENYYLHYFNKIYKYKIVYKRNSIRLENENNIDNNITKYNDLICFTHEWVFYDDFNGITSKIEKLFEICKKNNYFYY